MEREADVDPRDVELLSLAFERSPAGLLVVDDRGVILVVNAEIERLFGYARDELVGRPIELLVPTRFQTRHPKDRARYAQAPTSRPMGAGRDLFGVRKDGVEVPVEIGLNPIDTPRGRLVLGTVVDITGRRAIEGQLQQARKMEAMGTLASGVAHDFNNLLHGIVGHAELALRQAGPDAALREDLEQVLRVADRGRQLVERILTFGRRREVAHAPRRLEPAVREAVALLRASLPRAVEIRERFAPDTPAVRCDETQIQQIALNLATNAAHAMETGGVLELTLERCEVDVELAARRPGLSPGPHARLRVRDTGSGMTPEVLERALEPFYTTKPPGQGTGLGLSVVHGIAQSLGGAIEIESVSGAGTRVDVLLPAAAEGVAAEAEPPGEPAAARRPHLLVVEDEQGLAAMLRRQLEAFDYRATLHTSSVEALADFRSRPQAFDALMTDNSMPGMSGVALAREMLSIRPDLPVLLVSGTAAAADVEQLRRDGITEVLRKPHTGREMDAALKRLLATRLA